MGINKEVIFNREGVWQMGEERLGQRETTHGHQAQGEREKGEAIAVIQ